MPQTLRVLHGNYIGAIERAERIPSIVSANLSAEALGTAQVRWPASARRGEDNDPGGFLPASEAAYPVAYRSRRGTLG